MDKRRQRDGSERPDDAARKKVVVDGVEQPVIPDIRATDLEPYVGLKYLSKLFRFMAVILILLLLTEAVTGISAQGTASLPTLLGEASRLLVLAGLLWGVGDLALLLIDVGHDVRAGRILLSRQLHTMTERGDASVEKGPPPVAP